MYFIDLCYSNRIITSASSCVLDTINCDDVERAIRGVCHFLVVA